jgi:hypothetical protein
MSTSAPMRSRTMLSWPATTLLFVMCIINHAGGTSTVLNTTDPGCNSGYTLAVGSCTPCPAGT